MSYRNLNSPLYNAIITLGLQKGYSKELIKTDFVYSFLQGLQDNLIAESGIYLSANCYESILVLSGQIEPHLNLHFINYPKFPLTEDLFKKSVLSIANSLMYKFDQNRLVIQFHDEFVMIENSDEIDPKIKKQET